jgi:hypothetical protein
MPLVRCGESLRMAVALVKITVGDRPVDQLTCIKPTTAVQHAKMHWSVRGR